MTMIHTYPHVCATDTCGVAIRYVRHDPEAAHRYGRVGGYYDQTGRTRPNAGTSWPTEHYHAPAGLAHDQAPPESTITLRTEPIRFPLRTEPIHFPLHTPRDPDLERVPGRDSAPLMRICSCGAHIDPDTTDDKGRISCETCGNYYDGDTGAPLPHPEDMP